MKRTAFLLCAFSTLIPFGQAAEVTSGPHWAYDGATGQQHWSEIAAAFAACAAGTQQSPINIETDAVIDAAVAPPTYRWGVIEGRRVNNGHSIQVDVVAGDPHVIVDGIRYDLLQFHYHHVSEHEVNGEHFPLEAHYVHRSEAGILFVVAQLYETGGPKASLLHAVFDDTPPAGEAEILAGSLDLSAEAPTGDFYRYQGSLTTPPCSEIVTWHVAAETRRVDEASIDAFARQYPADYREVQPANRRFVLHGAAAR